MNESSNSVDVLADYLEALGVASGARARRRAFQLLNEYRAGSGGGGEARLADLLRLARMQAVVTESLAERPLPSEMPTKMPPQTFRYGGRPRSHEVLSVTDRAPADGPVRAATR